MTFFGHLTVALSTAVVGLAATDNLFASNTPLLLSIVAFGSLAPDIDEPGSYIGRKLGFISLPLKMIGLKHRTLTHWGILPVLIVFMSSFLDRQIAVYALALAFGILMHDVADMMTRGGIKGFLFPFFPTKTIRVLPKGLSFYTGSIQEFGVVVGFALVAFLVGFSLV